MRGRKLKKVEPVLAEADKDLLIQELRAENARHIDLIRCYEDVFRSYSIKIPPFERK